MIKSEQQPFSFRNREVSIWEWLIPNQSGKKQATALLDPDEAEPRLDVGQLRDDIRYIRMTYGLPIQMRRATKRDIEKGEGAIPAEKLSLPEAVPFVHALREEIVKYPPHYIARCKVAVCRLVKDLIDTTEPPTSLYYHIAGLAVYPSKYIYLSHDDNESRMRGAFHHELFHQSDQAQYDTDVGGIAAVVTAIQGISYNKAWANLNVKRNHPYLESKYTLKRGESHYDPVKGFAYRYGRKNQQEDRASLAEELMTNPAKLLVRAERDPILRAKIMKMKLIFIRRSGGLMNAQYFDDLANGKVKEGYWAQ